MTDDLNSARQKGTTMTDPLYVHGTATGGPLDGQDFTLPATPDIGGAAVTFLLGDTHHGYTLTTSSPGVNVLHYEGLVTPHGHVCDPHPEA